MLPKAKMRKVDVVVSVGLLALGVIVIHQALGMPWGAGRTGGDSAWYLSPGVFPLVVGSMITVFSIRVLIQAIRDGGHRHLFRDFAGWLAGLPADRKVHSVAIVFFLIAVYIFLLFGNVHYYIGTAGFLFVFMMIFYRPFSLPRPWRSFAIVVATSVLVPTAVGHVFSTYLYVPMP